MSLLLNHFGHFLNKLATNNNNNNNNNNNRPSNSSRNNKLCSTGPQFSVRRPAVAMSFFVFYS